MGWPASSGNPPVSTSPVLGLHIPHLSFYVSAGNQTQVFILAIFLARAFHSREQDSLISLEVLPCVFRKCPQREGGLGASKQTNHCRYRHTLPLWRVRPLKPSPGSHEFTQPFQEIQPQATGYPLKLTLGPPQTLSHSQLLLPWMEDSQRNVPRPICPWLMVFPPTTSRHRAQPIFLLSLSHQNSFLPMEPPHTAD